MREMIRKISVSLLTAIMLCGTVTIPAYGATATVSNYISNTSVFGLSEDAMASLQDTLYLWSEDLLTPAEIAPLVAQGFTKPTKQEMDLIYADNNLARFGTPENYVNYLKQFLALKTKNASPAATTPATPTTAVPSAAIPAAAAPVTSTQATIVMKNGKIFDGAFYAAAYPDVVAVYKTTDPQVMYQHYKKYGKKEGRFPSAAAFLLLE